MEYKIYISDSTWRPCSNINVVTVAMCFQEVAMITGDVLAATSDESLHGNQQRLPTSSKLWSE